MYLAGKGANIMGPGTSLVQRIDWTSPDERRMGQGFGCGKGLGGCGCGGKCGGLGLFDSGLDFSQWGTTEFAIVGTVGYMLLSTLFTTQRAARRVGSVARGAYRGARSSKANPGRRKRRARR